MKPWAGSVRNERGVALPLALFALVSLTAFVLTFVSMGSMEPQISRNLSAATQGRYAADAGIEWAFDQLANPATNWSTVLQGPDKVAGSNPQAVWMTGANGAQTTLPGLTAAFGTYTVQIRNDVLATDTALTGLPAEPAANTTTDTNGALIVTATGTYNNMTRQIQVVISRITIPTMPGALNCGGLQCDLDMGVVSDWTNHHFHSNGLDYAEDPGNPANMMGVSGPLKYAIATPTGNQPNTGGQSYESRVENALNKHQINEMDGLQQGSSPPVAVVSRMYDDAGKNAIAADSQLASKVDGSGNFLSNSVSDFVNKLKAQSVTVLQSTSGTSVTIQDGQPIGANNNLPVNLGTASNPTISYFKGDPNNASSPARVLILKGTNSGAGILIVEDGTLEVYDNFRWDGVIILTGKSVGVSFDKSVQANVYGGVILNETRKDKDTPDYELKLQKNSVHSEDGLAPPGANDIYYTKLYSSSQRVNQAQSIRSLVKTSGWREM